MMAAVEELDKCNICGSSQIISVDVDNNICECQSCAYVFDSPRPTAQAISEFYSKPTQYDSWLVAESARDVLWGRRLKKLKKICKRGSLLDVGTGIGQFIHHARPFFSKVSGSEVSSSAIEIAKNKYGLDLIEGDVTDIEFGQDICFDNITLFHVLEHVPDPWKTVQKCSALLSDGGVLVIAVPNDVLSFSRNFKSMLKRFLLRIGIRRFSDPGKLGLPKIQLDGSMDELHLSHFRPSVLQRLLEDSGFQIIANSLDPYYVASGFRCLRHQIYYLLASLIKLVLRKNIYVTIWIAGEKIAVADQPESLESHDLVGGKH